MNRTAMVFAGLGFELLGVILAGFFFGPVVDQHMGWQGTGFLVVSALLFVGWIVHFSFLIKQYMKESDEQSHNKP